MDRVTYFVKPYPFEGLAMSSITMHGDASTFKKEKVIRSFFERIRAAEQAPVVLAKK